MAARSWTRSAQRHQPASRLLSAQPAGFFYSPSPQTPGAEPISHFLGHHSTIPND